MTVTLVRSLTDETRRFANSIAIVAFVVNLPDAATGPAAITRSAPRSAALSLAVGVEASERTACPVTAAVGPFNTDNSVAAC